MFPLLFLTVGCLPLTSLAQANGPVDYSNRFLWPPLPGAKASDDPTVFYDNEEIEYGKPLSRPFTFRTQLSSMKIWLHQEQSPALKKSRLIRDCEPNYAGNQTTLFYWDGEIGDIDVKLTNIVFLAAYVCDDTSPPLFYSHYFNLTRAASLTSTSSSTSATLPTGTAIPTNMGTTASVGSTATASTTSNPSGETTSNNTAALAAGIGGGIGGALLLIAAAFALWRYKSRNKGVDGTQLRSPAYGFQDPHSGAEGSSVGLRSMTTSPVYSNAYGPPMYHQPSHNGTSVWNHQAFQQGDLGACYYKTDTGVPSVPPIELAGESRGRNHAVEM